MPADTQKTYTQVEHFLIHFQFTDCDVHFVTLWKLQTSSVQMTIFYSRHASCTQATIIHTQATIINPTLPYKCVPYMYIQQYITCIPNTRKDNFSYQEHTCCITVHTCILRVRTVGCANNTVAMAAFKQSGFIASTAQTTEKDLPCTLAIQCTGVI